MELIYLFTSLKRHEQVEAFSYNCQYVVRKKGSPVEKDIQTIGNSCFIVTFSIDSESKEAAHDLSDLNDAFNTAFPYQGLEKGRPAICHCLENGASSYFNKKLYPKMNDFERLLREYIYLKQQVSIAALEEQIGQEADEENKNVLKSKKSSLNRLFSNKPLEEMDFTEIYTKLFIDSRFCDEIKKRFFPEGEGKITTAYKVTKDEYLKFITETEENVVWSDLSEGKLEIIRINYDTIKKIRNDIMHAHNFDYKHFSESFNLIKTVLDELKSELSQLIMFPDNTQSIEGIIAALRTFASALDESRPDFERQFSKTWLGFANQLESFVDEEVMNKLLGIPLEEGEETDETAIQTSEIPS